LIAGLVLALVPWNLGLWWQFRRLRLAIELDCDQRVLRRRPDPAAYGRLLLDVGIRATHTVLPVTAFHEPVSSLERRILTMTAKRPRGAQWIAAGLVVGGAAALFFACEAPRPTAPSSSEAPAKLSTVTRDSASLPEWVRGAMEHYYPELVSGRASSPAEVWFVADADHHVLRSAVVAPQSIPGTNLGATHNLSTVVPDFQNGIIQSITPGATQGWARGNVRVVWVTVSDSSHQIREMIEGTIDSIRNAEEARLGSHREPSEAEARERAARENHRN
jgi:hypothetical protein